MLRRLREAGAVILGKTHMHELAFGASGYNHAYPGPQGPGTRNAYDPSRIAGGSSSGSGAAARVWRPPRWARIPRLGALAGSTAWPASVQRGPL